MNYKITNGIGIYAMPCGNCRYQKRSLKQDPCCYCHAIVQVGHEYKRVFINFEERVEKNENVRD